MVVAMRPVPVVQVAGNEVIGMVAVRNAFMPARRTVLVRCVVLAAGVPALAAVRIRSRDAKAVLVDVLLVDMMQVSVVKVIDVIFVTNGRVAAPGRVRMGVLIVHRVLCHEAPRLGSPLRPKLGASGMPIQACRPSSGARTSGVAPIDALALLISPGRSRGPWQVGARRYRSRELRAVVQPARPAN